jgi:hypothetical protein
MPLLQSVAESLSNNDLIAGVVEEIIDRDELYALMPFTKTIGKAYVYNREVSLSEGQFIGVNQPVPEGAGVVAEVTTKLRILIGDVDVDKFLDGTMDDTNSQKAVQIAMKAKGIGRAFRRVLISGDNSVNDKEFDGINKLVVDTGMELSVATNGAALNLTILDELKDFIPNGPDAYMMRSGTLRALKSLLRAAGGNTAEMFQIENFGRTIPSFDGIPIIVNDFIPKGVAHGSATDTCSIYALRLNEMDGLHGLYGGENAGVSIEDLGTVQDKDATRTRLKWYCGLALKSTQSLGAIRGITNV